MELRQICGKKSLKLLFLLFTSLLIGVVSATIYSNMFIQGSGTITSSSGLSWQLGTNAPSGAHVEGYTVTGLNLSIPQNTFQNFTDCLELKNNDATSHTFGLQTTLTGGATTNFATFNLVVYTNTGAQITKINILSGGSPSGLTIEGSQTLYIRFEVAPVTNATSGYMAFTVELTYQ